MAGQPVGADTWPFEPQVDVFSPASLLDLRHLNERQAGESGFIKVDAKGGFQRGDGQPIRFWAVNSGVGHHPFVQTPLGAKQAPDLARHARFLAKRGVNMVRLHRQLSPDLQAQPRAALEDINRAERDSIWQAVAAFKKEGIYTTLSPYWAGAARLAGRAGLAGEDGGAPWGLLFFEPNLQRAYKAWLQQLLVPPNPHTGVPLAREPALAIFQIQNEDSLLFWTFDRLRPEHRALIEQRYAAFLASRHGSLARAVERWSGERIEAGPLATRAPLLGTWELTQAQRGGRALRAADQTEFLARTMHDFNADIMQYLRNELGVRALVNAGNWKTASATRLHDAERWSYLPGEVDAANVYTGGLHEGPHNGWAVAAGDRYTSLSVLREPRQLPLALRQTMGPVGLRPMLLTEGNWVMPNAHAAEGPWLVAIYGALLGIDGYYWFSTGDTEWTPPRSANGWLPSIGKWTFATPEILGSFPAAAWAFRQGYVAEAPPALVEHRALADLWARRTPLLAELPSFDPNRDAADLAPGANIRSGVAFEHFLVGPVWSQPGGDPRQSQVQALRQVGAGPLRAGNGQVVLDARAGFATVDTPYVQGVAAHFANAPEHHLSDVRLVARNAYGAVLVVAMDGEPLSRSRRVLVQYATRSRPTGWAETAHDVRASDRRSGSGWRIDSHGQPPWQVESAELAVTLRNRLLVRAQALDMNGLPVATLPVVHSEGHLSFSFPRNAMYVMLR